MRQNVWAAKCLVTQSLLVKYWVAVCWVAKCRENLVKKLRGFQHNYQLSTRPGHSYQLSTRPGRLPASDPVQRMAAAPGRAGGLAQGRGHSGRATAPPGTGVLHPVLSETILQVSEVLHGLTRPQVFAMRQQTQVHLMSVDWDNVE